ncbi:MAG: hypothetical protein NC453_23715 [Muribaculum sp.]|nr:hypothetical protein [Muribaculum sp.]
MNNKLENLLKLNEAYRNMPSEMMRSLEDIFKSYGITKLALWYYCEDEDCPEYNEEDMELMECLCPTFDGRVDWWEEDSGNPDCSDGQVIAIEYKPEQEDKLKLVLRNDTQNCVQRCSIDNYDMLRIDFCNLIQAITDSIKFNVDNNIPVEKWGVGHCPEVDPYTYELLD